jgi:hypothetical protein
MSNTRARRDEPVDVRAIARRAGFFAVVVIAAGVLIASLPGVDEIRQRLSSADRGGSRSPPRYGSGRCWGSCALCGLSSTA